MKKLLPLFLFFLVLIPTQVYAGTVKVKLFPVSRSFTPGDAAPGPNGSIWFTDLDTNSLGSFLAGKTTEYATPARLTGDIARGAQNTLWLAAQSRIVRRSSDGAMTVFTLFQTPRSLTYTEGKIWFLEGNFYYGSITPEGDITKYTFPTDSGISGDGLDSHMTAGPDGNLWITESNANRIARLTPDGKFTEFSIPSAPMFQGIQSSRPGTITAGPDKSLWFTETVGDKIGKVSLDGKITEIIPHSSIGGPELALARTMTLGSDGALWLTIAFPGQVWRVAPNGAARMFSLGQDDNPDGIASIGLDIWVASAVGFYQFTLL